jgi:uncharacterized membrane protein
VSRPLTLLALFVLTLSWSAALTAAPIAASPRVAALTYAAGSLICHQRPERSFHYQGAQSPVCARCAGLYAGAVAGVLLWAAAAGVGSRPRTPTVPLTNTRVIRRLLFLIALPTLVSVTASWFGWWEAGNIVRAALAVPLGAAIAAVIAGVAAGDLR